MEQEKIKEIKECLENCINDCGATSCPYNTYEKGLKCIEDLQKDCLTLINELESENKLLREAKVVYENVDYCYEDLKKAKDRITELEKEIAKNTNCLKQFAERLKEKFYYEGRICREIIDKEIIDKELNEFMEK